MLNCPICNTTASHQLVKPDDGSLTPYWVCPKCNCWFQDLSLPKTYEASHEKNAEGGFTGHLMSDFEKGINKSLATNILTRWFDTKPIKMLDIGAKYPWLAHCFKDMGCDSYAMDNIEIVPEYSKELNVPMLMADFEKISEEQIQEWTKTDKFNLITMIHLFEHLYHPLEALRKMRKLLTDDGILFIRLPGNDVSGYLRDLTPGHYTIHPFFHSLDSLLELLVQAEDLFTIEWTEPMEGAGQRDLVLRPITKKPSIYAGFIVKNEERDLPKAIRSIKDVVDGIAIVDTGSTDNTHQAALEACQGWSGSITYRTYTDASERDETGDWKLWDFSKARNQFVSELDANPKVDYIFWFDADDTLLTPNELKRAVYLDEYTVFGTMIESGDRWVHHRLWKTRQGIEFQGAIHEYPSMGGYPQTTLENVVIHHDAAPGTGENSNARNLRILLREYETNPSSRNRFYLANTYKDNAQWPEAIRYYDERITMGEYYRDEWLFAYLYKARCERINGQLAEAERTLLEGVAKAPNWSEFWMEVSYIYLGQGRFQEASSMALMAAAQTPSPTALWREGNKYGDQPLRTLSFCAEYMGELEQSIKWAYKAKTAIKVEDKEWDARIVSLEARRLLSPKRSVILVRPGAIGDVLMTLNCIPALKKLHPDHQILYYCSEFIGKELTPIMKMAGVDEVKVYGKDRVDMSVCDKFVNLVGYPLQEGYPNVPMQKHLIEYFAAEMGLPERITTLSLPLPKIDKKKLGLPFNYATLQVKAGWSVYKSLEVKKWEEVIKCCPEVSFVQIGAADEPKIPGAIHTHMGRGIQPTIELIANAKMHIGLDSYPNHVTHFLWKRGKEFFRVPSVIVWGSTQISASGYSENTNISLNLPCQAACFREDPTMSAHPKGPCLNPPGQVYENPQHACMAGISVEMIVQAIKSTWGS